MCQNRFFQISDFWVSLLARPWLPSLVAFGGWAARSADAVVAGAGKASAADPRRGKPSTPRPGEKADPHNDDHEVATTLLTMSNSGRFGSTLGRK